jgi:hypothetical protein
MRTTVDIADPILEDVKRVQQLEGKALGKVVSELLAEGLAARARKSKAVPTKKLRWLAKDLGSRVDLRDKDTLWALLDSETLRGS